MQAVVAGQATYSPSEGLPSSCCGNMTCNS